MEKKQKQTKTCPKPEDPSYPKLLVSIPATLTSHMQFRPQVVEAIKAALGEVPYTFDAPDPNSLGWGFVVDAYNKLLTAWSLKASSTYLLWKATL